ncbi:hypothetical protein B566_EDAN005403 [Ephemera danica]|nr:hypothetical protein B566_EDAN005403 [Ephemera danica]
MSRTETFLVRAPMDLTPRHWLAVLLVLILAAAAGLGVPLAMKLQAGASLEERLEAARRLLSEVPLIDGHNDLPWNIRKFLHNHLAEFRFSEDLRKIMPWKHSPWSHTDLPRIRDGLVGAQRQYFVGVWVDLVKATAVASEVGWWGLKVYWKSLAPGLLGERMRRRETCKSSFQSGDSRKQCLEQNYTKNKYQKKHSVFTSSILLEHEPLKLDEKMLLKELLFTLSTAQNHYKYEYEFPIRDYGIDAETERKGREKILSLEASSATFSPRARILAASPVHCEVCCELGTLFWAAYVPCEAQFRDAVQLTLEQIDVIRRLTEKYEPALTLCASAADIRAAHEANRLCSLIGVEGGHALGNSLAVLRSLYDLGVRYLTLTSTCNTPCNG